MSVKDCINQQVVHQPRNSAETELVRASTLAQNKEKLSFVKIEKDGIETVVENHQPKRSLEFNTAASYYLSDAAKYLCTHYKEVLDTRNKLYVMAELDREIFFDITIGKFTDQYHRFMNGLSNVGDRKCYIPNGKGGYYIMLPFMLAFETENQEKLTENERRRLKNITHRGEVARKIAKVYFYFAKPLFEEYLTGANRQYYKHPKNLFSAIYDFIKKEMPIVQNSIGANLHYHVESLVRFIDYLYIHGAGDPNKKQLTLSLSNICSEVVPQYVQRNSQGRIRIRNYKEAGELLATAVNLTSKIDGLDYKVTGFKFGRGSKDNLIFGLEHPYKHLRSTK
jgi:hypothetical protein